MSEHPPLDRTVDHGSADPFDAGLAAAFGPDSGPPLAAGSSVLRALGAMLPDVPQVQLRDPDGGAHSPEMPEGRDPIDRLQLHGEIARGGMGAVLRGRDVDLGREIAVKVLLESHAGRTELVQRFVEEAQIAGQLQHPGIVPVYEMGQFPDKRPYFTMKLVKGQTLAKLLANRADPADERSRCVGVFLQICQAMGYAHAHGVIHRDLKPSNVIVGSFGEVQVLDWGLAKVLKEGGVADEKKARLQAEDLTAIRTRRSEGSDAPGSAGTQTQAGSVLGTPAYMPPEQALGEVDRLDERADVFGLGAILCEVLTGKPPYVGESFEQVHRKAIRADLGDAFARLDGCGADAELVALCKRCLAGEPQPRPRNAGELAGELSAHLQGVEARLRQAELAHAAARARAEEERKRRKLTVALAGSVLLTVLLGGGGWLWIAQQQAAREREAHAREAETARQVHEALSQANALREQARQADDQAKWAEARAMAKRAEALVENGPATPELARRVRDLVTDLKDEENDRRLLTRLDQIQLDKTQNDGRIQGFGFDEKRAMPKYAAAFAECGLNVSDLPAEEAARRIRERSERVREALVAALDDWLDLARRYEPRQADRLARVVGAADPDPWRRQLRQALARDDRVELDRLAGAEEFARQRPQTILLLARYLQPKSPHRAIDLLRAAQRRFPADFWINYTLAKTNQYRSSFVQADRAAYIGEALRFVTAALALRPDSPQVWCDLAWMLDQGREDESLLACRRVIELAPEWAAGYTVLSHRLHLKGRLKEANAALKKAIDLQPEDCYPYYQLGLMVWGEEQRHDEAAALFRRAVALVPQDALVDTPVTKNAVLGIALMEKGRFHEAAADCQQVVARNPELAHSARLGLMVSTRQADTLIASCRKAIAAQPRNAQAYDGLAWGLYLQGKFEEALAAFRTSQELSLKGHGLALSPVARWVREAERLKAIDGQWSDYAAGKLKPQDRTDRRLATLYCVIRKRYLAAARLHADGLGKDAKWADDPDAEARYDAARYAALAAAGQGQDAGKLDAAERSGWRKQAVKWLRAELTRQAKHLERTSEIDRRIALDRLRWWQQEPDLAGLRDAAALKALPEEERQACEKLWADVATLSGKATVAPREDRP